MLCLAADRAHGTATAGSSVQSSLLCSFTRRWSGFVWSGFVWRKTPRPIGVRPNPRVARCCCMYVTACLVAQTLSPQVPRKSHFAHELFSGSLCLGFSHLEPFQEKSSFSSPSFRVLGVRISRILTVKDHGSQPSKDFRSVTPGESAVFLMSDPSRSGRTAHRRLNGTSAEPPTGRVET